MTADGGGPDLASILEQALATPPEERGAYLDEVCGADSELRRRIEGLLDDPSAGPTLVQGRDGQPIALPDSGLRADPYKLQGTTVLHYEIRERLGRGGMGVVYQAFDTRLKREVALKFILLSMSAEPEARERFVAEARAASALDHVNICTIYEIGETESGQVYIGMAYYKGETLADRLARGRLSTEEALDFGAQIASGLAAAHAKEILHRDVKPANVMVTEPAPAAERGIAKILDFGLAKVEDVQLTRSGTTMGTAAYSSPEQARGERVDQRTDIWAVGVILYEMLAGERPFKGDTTLAVLQSLTTDEPRPLRQINPEVPEELERVVATCLEKDRERRYAAMTEVLEALRTFLVVGSRTYTAGPATAGVPEPRARRWWWVALAGAVAMLMAIGLAVPVSRQALLRPLIGAPAPAPKLVAVLPFINTLGAGSENQALADGLTHTMTGMIGRLGTAEGSLWIVPANEIIQRGVATAGDARRLFGVDTVVTGSVQRAGLRTEVVLAIVDPVLQPPRTIDSATVAAPLSAATRDEALDALGALLGISSDTRSRLPAAAEAAVSAAANTLYLQGLGYLQRFEQPGNLDAAIAAFGKALDEDSSYAPAQAGLCEALWDKYRQTEDQNLADRAVVHCDRAAELAQGQAGVLVSIGRIDYERGELRQADAELRQALRLEPGNAEAFRWLGWVHHRKGAIDEAEEALRQAIALKPRLWIYYNDLGIILNSVGRHEESAELFEEVRRLTPENYLAYNALAVVRQDLNQVGQAERLFRRALELQPNPLSHRNLGALYFREQQYDRAVRELQQARDLHLESPSFNDWIVYSWLGHASYWSGDKVAANAAWRRLIEIATPLFEVNSTDSTVLMLLADAHVALGELEQGRYYLNRLLALPIEAVYTRYYMGRIYEMMGDRQLALDYIAQALEGRFDPLTVDRDPWLEDLREEARYRVLRQQFLTSAPASARQGDPS